MFFFCPGLAYICDQKQDYKLELSEINQRFSGDTVSRPNTKPDQTVNALLNTVSQKTLTQYTAKPSTSPLCVSPRELSSRTNELFKDHPSKHSWAAKECDSVLNALVCDLLQKKTFVSFSKPAACTLHSLNTTLNTNKVKLHFRTDDANTIFFSYFVTDYTSS